MDKKRLNIALLVSEFEDGYTRSLCEGAVSAAKELDANLFIFPGRYLEAHNYDLYRTKYDLSLIHICKALSAGKKTMTVPD